MRRSYRIILFRLYAAPSNDQELIAVLITKEKHSAGMNAEEALSAGGLMIAGSVCHANEIRSVLEKEYGDKMVLVEIKPTDNINMDDVMRGLKPTIQTIIIEAPLQFDCLVVKQEENRPPWMGKKPWWNKR